MSVLDALDATRICARRSAPAAAWANPAPPLPRPRPVPVPHGDYSWWSLARNPHAMLMTGLIGAMVATDTVARMAAQVTAR
jgi:hypothetical protein